MLPPYRAHAVAGGQRAGEDVAEHRALRGQAELRLDGRADGRHVGLHQDGQQRRHVHRHAGHGAGTLPAGREADMGAESQPHIPPPPRCSAPPSPVLLAALDALPGLVHLDVLVAVAGDVEDAAQGVADAGGGTDGWMDRQKGSAGARGAPTPLPS